MAAVEDRSSPSPSPKPPSKRRLSGWSDLWVKKNGNPLKNVLLNMQQLQSLSPKHPKSQTLISTLSQIDKTLLLPDEILLKILSLLPHSQRNHNFLVCKRWLNLQGRLVRSLKVLNWDFLDSGRLITRFPNLTHLDLLNGCLISARNSGILLSHKLLSVNLGSGFVNACGLCENKILHVEDVDRGLGVVASGCPNLRKFAVLGASELGLLSVAEDCSTLQELELHKCNDNVLRGIAACENLQVLKLVGNVDALYSSVVSDIGLTILAQGSKRLVKLELSGCGGSFDGIKAIGQCCQMLEELTLSNHGMEDGWLAGLPYCENLKTLRLVSCKKVDDNPGPKEYLGSCLALERLHLQNCHMGRKKKGLRALFRVCETVKEVVLHDCWGLDPEKFILAKAFRKVHHLSLEACSLITTESLESVILSWSELQHLRVVSCKNIKDSEISPALATLFSTLKGFKWRPDSKSLLGSCLAGTGVGQKGGKLLKKILRPEFSASKTSAFFG